MIGNVDAEGLEIVFEAAQQEPVGAADVQELWPRGPAAHVGGIAIKDHGEVAVTSRQAVKERAFPVEVCGGVD